jgi:hypothetical protein
MWPSVQINAPALNWKRDTPASMTIIVRALSSTAASNRTLSLSNNQLSRDRRWLLQHRETGRTMTKRPAIADLLPLSTL